MRLTRFTDYALRLLLQLAHEPGGRATVGGVAARQGLSKHHIGKVAHALTRAGFIEAVRGRAGGLRLAHPAADISIGAVVRCLEPLRLIDCSDCAEAAACSLSASIDRAADAFLVELDGVSLAGAQSRSVPAH